MILDNVFSGLDSTTADHIFDKVFSSGGLKDILDITTVIVSHNGKVARFVLPPVAPRLTVVVNSALYAGCRQCRGHRRRRLYGTLQYI